MEIRTSFEILRKFDSTGYSLNPKESKEYSEFRYKKWVAVDSEITFCNLIKEKLENYSCGEHKKIIRLINQHLKKLSQK